MNGITTFLMFIGEQSGKAESAVNFYTSIFNQSKIINIERYGAENEDNEPEGLVKKALFTINRTEFMAMDSALDHQFNFTPSISLYIECDSLEEIESVFEALVDGGSELVPLDSYGASQKFGWLNDKYGVSWQLNLAKKI